MTLARRLVAEFMGTAFLLVAVVGSGIMGERLAGGNVAIALLANSLATGAALIALILTFGPISGAHFNPAVSVALAARGDLPWENALYYSIFQVIGAILGVAAAHAMFGLPLIEFSAKARSGVELMWAEFVATFGLLAVIVSGVRFRPEAIPYAVAAYITGAYWFTASTSFANPAVTMAREFTNSFSGIRQEDVPGFLIAQAMATFAAVGLFAWLLPPITPPD
jgi:glycerol uptake facilitator-like aquaporin